MNNKKNKKQRGGFVDMTNPMIIFGIISVICLIYGVLVYLGYAPNPMEWFNSEANTSLSEANTSLSDNPLFRTASMGPYKGNTLQEMEKPMPTPEPKPDLWKGGGKLLKKFRKK